jgi:hypothetical protein
LVEFLWSIPDSAHAQLFWDKEIVRKAASRWLPEHFCRRRKVPFFQGTDSSSVTRMFFVLFRNAWPSFVERYLDPADSLFDRKVACELSSRVSSEPNAIINLFRLMALAIFDRQGSTLPREHFPGVMTSPSPLRGDLESRPLGL